MRGSTLEHWRSERTTRAFLWALGNWSGGLAVQRRRDGGCRHIVSKCRRKNNFKLAGSCTQCVLSLQAFFGQRGGVDETQTRLPGQFFLRGIKHVVSEVRPYCQAAQHAGARNICLPVFRYGWAHGIFAQGDQRALSRV